VFTGINKIGYFLLYNDKKEAFFAKKYLENLLN